MPLRTPAYISVCDVDEGKLLLLFEGNSTIEITNEICDCYYAGGSAVVNNISLQGLSQYKKD